ncbi:hypothetical protein [Luteolibacter sp. Populi]|uniref:hypothetical protein n=1 Tax=Luteolibacter sp. Populi TaxID=3230487 RepID=UPI003465A5B1
MYPDPRQPCPYVHWSGDGSVLAVRLQERNETRRLFDRAYDYREHREIGQYDRVASDREIMALMESRGGVGPQVTGIDEPKMTKYTAGYPWWGWLAPAGIMVAALRTARKTLRKM